MADTELTLEELPKLKVAELKKACKDRNLPISGTKAELLTRLQESLQLQMTEEDGADGGDISDSEQDINLEDTLETEPSIEEEKDKNTEPAAKKIALTKKEDTAVPESAESKIVLSKGLTDEERLKKRAEKFGIQSEEARKKLRAERFGIADKTSGGGSGKISSTPLVAGDLDKLKQRAERFGTVVSNKLSKLEEAEKIARRKERFGTELSTTNKTNGKISVNSTLSSAELEKKKKRAERFGLTT